MNRGHGVDFGLGRGIGSRPPLLVFLPPVQGKVAVQVQSLFVGLNVDQGAVIVFDLPLGEQAVVLSPRLGRFAADEQARVLRVGLPGAIRVRNAHHQHAPIAIHVFSDQAADGLLIVGIGARAGADEFGLVGEGQLGAIGIHPRADIKDTRVHAAGDVGL